MQLRGYLHLLLLGLICFLLVRFFPLAARVAEGAALGLRRFWWMVLVFGAGLLMIWALRRKTP